MSRPFRFYGARPSHWLDDQFVYEVAFETQPSAATKERLAARFVEQTFESGLDFERWLWNDRFAVLGMDVHTVQNLGTSRIRQAFDEDLQRLFEALHDVAPIDQVVFRGATEADDAWTRWSRSERGEPAPLPAPVAADPPFSRAVDRLWRAREHDHERALVEQALSRREPGKLGVVRCPEPPPRPPPSSVPEAVRRALSRLGDLRAVSPSPNGTEALAIREPNAVRVELATGALRVVHACDHRDLHALRDTTFAEGGRWVVLTATRLLVFDPESGRLTDTVAVPDSPSSVRAVRDGRVLVAGNWRRHHLYACTNGKLSKLGEVGRPFSFGYEADGRLFFEVGDETFELTGAEPPRPPSKGKAKPELSLEPVSEIPPQAQPAPGEAVSAEERARFVVGADCRKAGGRVVARIPTGKDFAGRTLYGDLAFSDGPEHRVELGEALGSAGVRGTRGFALSPDGRAGFFCEHVDGADHVFEIRLDEAAVARVLERVWDTIGNFKAAVALDADTLVLLGEKALVELRRDPGQGFGVCASVKLAKAELLVWCAALEVALVLTVGKYPALFFARRAGGWTKLGGLLESLASVSVRGSDVFVTGARKEHFRVAGLSELAARARARKSKSAR